MSEKPKVIFYDRVVSQYGAPDNKYVLWSDISDPEHPVLKCCIDGQWVPYNDGGASSLQVRSDWNETNHSSPAYIKNKPKINGVELKGNMTSEDLKLVDKIVVGKTKTGEPGTGAKVKNSGTTSKPVLDFTIPRGRDAVNPFKGWFDPDEIPTEGKDGEYCYVTDNGISTVYKWNGTAFVDSGEPVDTSSVQTFRTSESVNHVGIDDTHLQDVHTEDDTNYPVIAKATDVMNVNQKLDADFQEERVEIIQTGAGQNVFDGYVLVKRGYVSGTPYYERQNECPLIYTNNLHPEYKHVVVDVAGCDSVRFMAHVGNVQVPDQGWAFYDEDNYSGGQFLTDNTGYIQYSSFDSDDTVGYKQYIVNVPDGAKYMKISYLTQDELENTYIYRRFGKAVLGDSVNKNRHVVKNLLDYGNFIRGMYIVNSSGWVIPDPEIDDPQDDPNYYARYGVMSNKLYLEEGQTYTISNAVVNSETSTIRIVRFTEDDEYMTYFGVPARKTDIYSGTTTSVWKHFGYGTFTYHNVGEDYVRIVIRVNVGFGDNDGSSPSIIPHAQLEIGSQVTDFAKFNEVEDYDLASGQFERDAKQQLMVNAYEDIEEGEFADMNISGKAVADYRRRHTGNKAESGYLRLVNQSNVNCKVFKVEPLSELYFSCDLTLSSTAINMANYALQFVNGVWNDDAFKGEIYYQEWKDPAYYDDEQQDMTYEQPSGITWVRRSYVIRTGKQTKYTHNRFIVPEDCNAIIMNSYNNSFKIQKKVEVDSSLQEVYDHIDELTNNLSTKQTINILSIGNSGSQDSLAYVPFLIHDIAPEVNVNIGIAMLSSSSNFNALNNFNYYYTPYPVGDPTDFHQENTRGGLEDPTVTMRNNGKSYTYYKCGSNDENWTQKLNQNDSDYGLWSIQEIVTEDKWDVVLLNATYTRLTSDDPYSDLFDCVNDLTDKIMQVVTHPIKVGIINTEASVVKENGKLYTGEGDEEHGRPQGDRDYLKQRGLNRSIAGRRIIEGFHDDDTNHTYETLFDIMLPVNTAIENALTVQDFRNMGDLSKHVNNFNWVDTDDHSKGKEGYLKAPDGVHLQEGLPCQIAAYAVICKILEMSDIPYKSILGDKSICNEDWTSGKSIPGPHPDESSGPSYTKQYTEEDVRANAHTGFVPMDEGDPDYEEHVTENLKRVRFAQKCAVMACKHPYEITDMNDFYTATE